MLLAGQKPKEISVWLGGCQDGFANGIGPTRFNDAGKERPGTGIAGGDRFFIREVLQGCGRRLVDSRVSRWHILRWHILLGGSAVDFLKDLLHEQTGRRGSKRLGPRHCQKHQKIHAARDSPASPNIPESFGVRDNSSMVSDAGPVPI